MDLRSCGRCEACCISLRIEDKPPGRPCLELTAERGHGCRHYADRPEVCREYECLWRQGGADLLTDDQRPDRCGVIFSAKLASECGLPPINGGDWLLAVAMPAAGRDEIAIWPDAMEAVRRVRVAGLHVLLDERRATGHTPALEAPLRPPAEAFIRRLAAAINHTDPAQTTPDKEQ